MSDEYLTLTSDASLDVFADNKIGQFRVKLPKKIYLDRSRHQIGLKYISFPHKTYNIEDGTFSVIVHKLDLDDTIWPIQFNTKIPSGYYNCLLYKWDAADERSSVNLAGGGGTKKQKQTQ